MRIRNLTKAYPVQGKASVKALQGITFNLPETGVVIILGESGSGKTTMLNLLSGMDTPSAGSVVFRGQDFSDKKFPIDDYRNTYCSFIFQEYNLLPEFNVEENISLALEMQGNTNSEKITEALKRVGLSGYEKRRLNELSGGQQQRVAVARAIAKDSAVIFADEPTGALDEETGNEIFALLKEFSKERLIVVATHDKELALQYADRVITLSAGKIVSDSKAGVEYAETEKPLVARRAKLPLKRAFQLGAVSYKRQPWRLFFTLLLSVISFSLFALPVDVALWNNETAFYHTTYENGSVVTSIKKVEDYDLSIGDLDLANNSGKLLDLLLGVKEFASTPLNFTAEDLAFLQSKTDVPLFKQYKNRDYSFQKQVYDISNHEKTAELNELQNSEGNVKHFMCQSEQFVAMDFATARHFGFEVTGRMPNAENEVAINECVLHNFEFYGFLNSDGSCDRIEKPEDMLGRQISVKLSAYRVESLAIVGVVDTGCKKDCWRDNAAVHNAYHEALFLAEEAILSESFLCYSTPESQADYEEFIGFLLHYRTGESGRVHYSISNDVSEVLIGKEGTIVQRMNGLLLWLGAIFFVMSFIFLCNYIGGAIRRQLHEIGVLSALGIRARELIKIYGLVTLLICGVTFVFSLIATGVCGIFLNKFFAANYFKLPVRVCTFHPLVVLFLALALAAVAFVGCVLPILHYKRKSSVSVINEGKIK